MALRQILLPWTTQPQEAVRVDPGHPLGRCLDALWIGNSRAPIDLIGGRVGTGAPAGISVSARADGLAIVGSTSSGTAFSIPSVTAYPYVCAAYGAVSALNSWQLFTQTGSGGSSGLSVSSTGLVQFKPRRNFGTSRTLSSANTYAANTPLCIVVQVFSDTDYRLYVNGEQANGTLSFGTGGTWLINTSAIGSVLSGHIYLVGYGSGRGAMSDAEALAISADPAKLWGVFEPQRIFVPMAAAGGSASVTASQSLSSVSQEATAAATVAAAAAQALPAAALSASAAAVITAQAAQSLPAPAQLATATVGSAISASANQALPPAALAATAAVTVQATAGQALPAVGQAAAASVLVAAQAAQSLPSVIQMATIRSGIYLPSSIRYDISTGRLVKIINASVVISL